MGFSVDEKSKTITYREWAPNPAISDAFLIGDFNGWNRSSHRMNRDCFGVWSITLEADPNTGEFAIPHASKVKLSLVKNDGERLERVPAWITRCEQDQSKSLTYEGVFWNPPQEQRYSFKHTWPMPKPDRLRIYEAHGATIIITILTKFKTYLFSLSWDM
jgi:1,4-alpha-glucan branching enzyme